MRPSLKIAGAFVVVAGLGYVATWGATIVAHVNTSGFPETTRDYSDNGLRILTTDFRSSRINDKLTNISYAVLLDSKEHGVVACHGIASSPKNTWAGKKMGNKYPDTLYADSPIANLVYKKSDTIEDNGVLQLGSCFKYETPLEPETIDALASDDYKNHSFRSDIAKATADVATHQPHYGFPIMKFQDNDYVTIATAPEENHITEEIKEPDMSGKPSTYIRSGDVTRIMTSGMINDTVRDRRYLNPLKVIFGDLNTSERHPITQQVCMNAGFNGDLAVIADYHGSYGSTLEEEKRLLGKLGKLQLTECLFIK